ncbi:uncharacterized protein F5147DRAFT_746009 [Suillus discolor]|uniref:CxC2-like cysteine cluster KDZ transposase-associated domain-containing protein n=1 Tax=Suillus discolor TaxID=1912936 RepID=A0A9P7F4X4_9AGAM|nr:uncharacterized protein F5147DRAFT_746009 [Suillus discolor]KAG2107192.1 hypothetical protein F5147DRAFT_746009 [Suillus discolor]
MDERDLFLAELLRHEGCGDHISDACPGCPCLKSTPPRYRCQDCLDSQLYCGLCIVRNHLRLPTHHIEEWNRQFFECLSLKAMGLRIQLGHAIGESCILPRRAFNDDFVLIDANGIHEIGLDFCGCMTSQTHTKQLLCLIRRKDHYESFMHMVREWCHLVMLKCSGHGHDPSGMAGTSEGQCAVLCPACPQPGKNLPDNLEDAPKAKGWLYSLFLAIDANFHLKRRAVSSDETNPSLSRETSYKSYISDRAGDVQEKSTCSSHNAMNMAETKLSQGLAATGVGTVDCARHNMKCPNGVGDLQKGEKYLNMDYLFFSTLRHSTVDILNVSYDIACQWHKFLWSRMVSLPPSHHLNYLARTIRFFVPKFHLPAHVSKCQTIFSFNFTHFVGHTDGEAPERGWSNINSVASSTKAMGPGCRRDMLDNHFGDWNWKKVVGLGSSLLLKIKEAQIEKADHGAAFEEFDSVITSEHRFTWKAEMEAWEENPNDTTVTNPLQPKGIAITQASARLSLAQLKAEELECGVDLSLHPDVSPSVLIASGIDLKEEHSTRWRLKAIVDGMGIHATDRQKLSILCMRMSLRQKIESWRQTQLLYVPLVQVLLAASPTGSLNDAELMKLWLPSALNSNACDLCLQHIEWELCFAQAHDALEELRQCLHREWIRGQGANTCAQNALTHIHTRQVACVKRYRTAWTTLKSLAPILKKADWCGRLQDLSDDDLMWIWMMDGVDSGAAGGDVDGVRVECEEVDLLQEEMRRVLQFFNWQANWWEGQGVRRVRTAAHHEATAQDESLHAYASRQANICWRLAAHFHSIWAPLMSPQDTLGNPAATLPLPDLTIPDMP